MPVIYVDIFFPMTTGSDLDFEIFSMLRVLYSNSSYCSIKFGVRKGERKFELPALAVPPYTVLSFTIRDNNKIISYYPT